jgi:hypothetical protein
VHQKQGRIECGLVIAIARTGDRAIVWCGKPGVLGRPSLSVRGGL